MMEESNGESELAEPEIKVRLLIADDLISPDTVSEFLKVAPTKVWIRGEKTHPKATNVYDHNGWVLIESAAGSTASAELLTKRIFDVVDIRNFKDLKAAHPGIEVVLSIIVYVTSSAPSVSLSKEQVKFLATIEGDLDIDIYPMSEPSGAK
jgi:hypothetical protein